MKIYYKIWVDCIVRMRSQESNKDTWREKSIFKDGISVILCLRKEVILINKKCILYFRRKFAAAFFKQFIYALLLGSYLVKIHGLLRFFAVIVFHVFSGKLHPYRLGKCVELCRIFHRIEIVRIYRISSVYPSQYAIQVCLPP